MPLSFIDWVSLIANIVTILGIGGFLITYISNRRKDKKIANETLANAIKLASVRLNLYRVKSKKIYRPVDYLTILKNELKNWKENIILFGIDIDWQFDEEVNLPSYEGEYSYPNITNEDQEDYEYTSYKFLDFEDFHWFNSDEIQDYLTNFNQLSFNKKKDILSYAVKNSYIVPLLDSINKDAKISDDNLRSFIDSILTSITSEGLAYNPYAKRAFTEFLDFQMKLEELLLYEKQFINSIVDYIIKLENPFVFFQEKWMAKNKLPIDISEYEYIEKRLSIVENLIPLIEKIENKLPK